jgi:hypothetical protein
MKPDRILELRLGMEAQILNQENGFTVFERKVISGLVYRLEIVKPDDWAELASIVQKYHTICKKS